MQNPSQPPPPVLWRVLDTPFQHLKVHRVVGLSRYHASPEENYQHESYALRRRQAGGNVVGLEQCMHEPQEPRVPPRQKDLIAPSIMYQICHLKSTIPVSHGILPHYHQNSHSNCNKKDNQSQCSRR
uniref:Uncharacterized protein MANES_17G083800 n=1 Tax=Rhizophora mucronata TaxID=61149 RepID=A0A2P2MT42_RHIMU